MRDASKRPEREPIGVDVRKLPKSAIAVDLTVPKSAADEIHLRTLGGLAKKAEVSGFKKGNAPPQMVLQIIGEKKVKEATVGNIVDVGIKQSGLGERIRTVGEARLATKSEEGGVEEKIEDLAKRYTIGEAISFTIEVDVYPTCEIEEAHYKGMEVEVERAEFNQEAYDKALGKLRHQHADLVPVGAGVPAEEGHEILVDMDGFAEKPDGTAGDPLPNVAGGADVNVPLKPGQFMPGLVEGLVGACDGDQREVRVTFPPRSSVPQLAGKRAVFKVNCKTVRRRVLAEVPSDAFADKVKPGMTWKELDAKLREGCEQDREQRQRANAHKALAKALGAALPEEFEVPETLVEQVTKERFAEMLSDMRERGASDAKLKELVTPEQYERYKTIARVQTEMSIKTDFALKTVGEQQGLVVSRDEVDDEIMTLQAQALQRGEKFKESEVRPKVEAQIERSMVLNWLESNSKLAVVDPKEETPEEILGQSPEDLAAKMRESEAKDSRREDSEPTDGRLKGISDGSDFQRKMKAQGK
jgi:trigger factor